MTSLAAAGWPDKHRAPVRQRICPTGLPRCALARRQATEADFPVTHCQALPQKLQRRVPRRQGPASLTRAAREVHINPWRGSSSRGTSLAPTTVGDHDLAVAPRSGHRGSAQLPPKTRVNMPEHDANTEVAAQHDGTQALVGTTPAVAPVHGTASNRGLLWALTALMVGACVVISVPLVPALAWALVLAIAGEWLRRLVAPHCRNPSLQAGLSVAFLAVVVTAPLFGLAPMVADEFQRAWADLRSESIRARVDELARQLPGLASVIDWLRQHAPSSEDVAAQVMPRVSGLFVSSVWGALQWPIAFFAAFFFLRDRQRILRWLAGLLPLQARETDRLFSRATQVVRANVLGIVLLAALQGLLGGLMFWWLGLPAALLWGVVMFVLSLLPVVGAAVVWIPAALWLALEGSMWKALLLAVWGGVIVALVDNLLYPLLVGNKLGLHTLAVFVALVGGLVVFGPSGLVLGPLSLVITAELIAVCKERRDSGRQISRNGDGDS